MKTETRWKRNKFRQGVRLKDIQDLLIVIDAGTWVYINNRPYHPAMVQNMTLRTLLVHLSRGRMHMAERVA